MEENIMNNNMTLLVMAAGMGSRFGGLKQIEPVGPHGEVILEFSVYDALEAGFDKAVFVIKKEIEHDFREIIGKRIEKMIDVEYAFQELNDIPAPFTVPADRVKPCRLSRYHSSAKRVDAHARCDDALGRSN